MAEQISIEKLLQTNEDHMLAVIKRLDIAPYEGLHQMLAYHMGWHAKNGLENRGKRIRPLVVLLVCAASGGIWENALPAAAAVELLHNFSLIHDDIEDSSEVRRGRPTVWAKWGVPQALNAGDTQFTLAHIALLEAKNISLDKLFLATKLLHQTCLELTQGQYLDISFETKKGISLDEYWTMISGKTASLLAACCGLGAIFANAPQMQYEAYVNFGKYVGLAFQALDDFLGIWGDSVLLGKSIESDLVNGKKSLPILYGLNHSKDFSDLWNDGAGKLKNNSITAAIQMLENCGAKSFTIEEADKLTLLAQSALDQAKPLEPAGQALRELAGSLLNRKF